jgi:endonuclease/exonuclease/phosphatase family metal-dependent hydrolase
MATVASYNIHRCIGRDSLVSPDRIAAVIRELDADVVALQEVEAQHRFGALDQWAFLAETLGYHCTPGISLRTQRRNYGNALLSRQSPKAVRLHDLSVDHREPRGAIDVDLTLRDGRAIRVIATHLGLRGRERERQIALLRPLLEPDGNAATTLLLGDLNEWRPSSANLKALHPLFHPSPAPPTFPARRPLFALDRILVAGAARIAEVAPHRSELAREASDHLPVRARLAWAGA